MALGRGERIHKSGHFDYSSIHFGVRFEIVMHPTMYINYP
jgi:hypothetical protein